MTPDPRSLTEDQIRFTVQCIAQWVMASTERYGHGPTYADVLHSALLRRLLSGKPLLPEPPPVRFSYPDYELAEGKEVEITNITTNLVNGEDRVLIDQCFLWEWSDQEQGILRHIPTGHLYRHYTRPMARPRVGKPDGESYEGKFLQRMS